MNINNRIKQNLIKRLKNNFFENHNLNVYSDKTLIDFEKTYTKKEKIRKSKKLKSFYINNY